MFESSLCQFHQDTELSLLVIEMLPVCFHRSDPALFLQGLVEAACTAVLEQGSDIVEWADAKLFFGGGKREDHD